MNFKPATFNPYISPSYTPPRPERPERRKPTGVNSPTWNPRRTGIHFPLYMFQMRGRCFNQGSPRHVFWLLRLRDACAAVISNIDDELEAIHVHGKIAPRAADRG